MYDSKPMTITRKLTQALLLALFTLSPLSPAMAEDSDEDTEVQNVTDYIAMEPAFVTHVGRPGTKVALP